MSHYDSEDSQKSIYLLQLLMQNKFFLNQVMVEVHRSVHRFKAEKTSILDLGITRQYAQFFSFLI